MVIGGQDPIFMTQEPQTFLEKQYTKSRVAHTQNDQDNGTKKA